ncbi:hypothetical protein BDZ91DRAFT_736746 [Kalaharituber pfeilii]|nr:hypothetical protein BDZ91DRAFT_736746 [Kalaharituber pfeilii]
MSKRSSYGSRQSKALILLNRPPFFDFSKHQTPSKLTTPKTLLPNSRTCNYFTYLIKSTLKKTGNETFSSTNTVAKIHQRRPIADLGVRDCQREKGKSHSVELMPITQQFSISGRQQCQTLQRGTIPFDFIIKCPDRALKRAIDLVRRDFTRGKEEIENIINDFLDELFNFSSINTVNEERSPLVYENHALFENDSMIAISVRLRDPTADVMIETARVCDRIHCCGVRDARICQRLTKLDVFGLEPVEESYFSICWDSAFFYNLLTNGQQILGQIVNQASDVIEDTLKACKCFVLGCFMFLHIFNPRGEGVDPLVRRIITRIGQDYDEVLRNLSILSLEILTLITKFGAPTDELTKWKTSVSETKNSLERVNQKMERLIRTPNQSREDHQILHDTSLLYLEFRKTMSAAVVAITHNREIMQTFKTQWILGLGIGLAGVATGGYMAYKATELTVRTLTPPALSFVLGIGAIVWGNIGRTRRNLCKSVDNPLTLVAQAVLRCQMLTEYLYLAQRRDPNIANLHVNEVAERYWREQMKVIQKETGQDPKSAEFLNNGYRVYMERQKDALTRALTDLRNDYDKIQKIN